ncbi:MAG: class I SAM-dependent methyltransferase [Maricaulis sp.]|nr:class I SAM-dependent methyltransferase [Maricaulis sp.]
MDNNQGNILDPRRLLAVPALYSLHSRVFGPDALKASFVEQILQVREGDRVLDIGCGPADLLAFFPRVSYFGFDANANYIEQARKKHGHRGDFRHAYVSEPVVDDLEPFDLIIANGVLHHLSDANASALFRVARMSLRPGGRLVTCDGVLEKNQNPLARLLINLDRGNHVRTSSGYHDLASDLFDQVDVSIHHHLSRLPYSHCVLQCRVSD